MDIYKELSKAGRKISNHCSDLHVPVDEVSTAIIEKYEFKGNVSKFQSAIEGEGLHYDIPFAYYPYHTKSCVI